MKKTTLTAACVLALAAAAQLTGCASNKTAYKGATEEAAASTAIDSVTELGKAYYAQPNVAELFYAEGSNLTFSVTGATRLCLRTPVPAKQIMPREQSWFSATSDVLKTIAPWIFMGYMFHEADFGDSSYSSSSSTVTN